MRAPYGGSLNPFVFLKLTDVFVNKLRDPESSATIEKISKFGKRWIHRRRRLAKAELLPFVDGIALFAKSFIASMVLK